MSGLLALLSTELRRLRSRRLFRIGAILIALGIVLAGVITLAKSHRITAVEIQAQQSFRQQQLQACEAGQLGIPPEKIPPGESLQEFCQNIPFAEVSTHSFALVHLIDIYKGTTVPIVLLAWLLGASFLGAEWHAGTMTTLLAWEPRRIRVLLMKAFAAILVAFVGAVLFQAVLGLALTPAAVLRGTTAGTKTRAWFETLLGVVLRGATLAAIAAAIGAAIATVARNTAAALGLAFGYLLIVENLLGVLRHGWRSWFFGVNAVVLVDGHRHPEVLPRSVLQAGLLLGLYGVAFLTIATSWFARRDVT